VRDLGAKAFAKLFSLDQNTTLLELDLSSCKIGDDGVLALYESLRTNSSDCRAKKCLELNLLLQGNDATMDIRLYAPDLDRRVKDPYDTLIGPNLARSKQTVVFRGRPYIDPVFDVPAWSRAAFEAASKPRATGAKA
jgi:hypothetical protein